MIPQQLSPEQKALEINLNGEVYGSFAEIGAGQEVARNFFQVGAAAGTIAKTISAYDKIVSDKIYGPEPSGRYVCESRLYKMLDHEYDLMMERLQNERPGCCLFAFADTVTAINYTKTIKGSGWMGMRFQLDPEGEPNDIVIHVKMQDNDNKLQQQAVGILGVNLIHGCYNYYENPDLLVKSLLDSLHGRVEVDMIRLSGPRFENIDNRVLSLMLVKNKLTEVAMFDSTGKNIHASEFLYKKYVLVVRGSFRPATLVNLDMIKKSYEQFRNEEHVDTTKTYLLSEITLDNLCANGELDERDFLDRAEVLCALGQTVVVSNCEKHQKLINYLSDYKVQKMGLVLGVQAVLSTISEKYYDNLDGRLLAAFGEIFTRNVKLYVYPTMQEGSEELMTCKNLPIPEEITFLFKHLMDNGQVADVENFNPETLHIYSKEVLRMIRSDEAGWDKLVPSKVAKLIREKLLFGFPSEKMEFEY